MLADIPPEDYAVAVKTLLVHSARWNEKGDLIKELCGPHEPARSAERTANATRFLGFGVPDIARVLDCAENQATLVGYGALQPDHAHNYRIPLPASLEGVTDPREVAITVTWFTPVRAGTEGYRAVKSKLRPSNRRRLLASRVSRTSPPTLRSRRAPYSTKDSSGERAVPFIDDGHLSVRVWCKDRRWARMAKPFRYVIAVTIQAGTPLRVYEEVRERLRVRPRPPA